MILFSACALLCLNVATAEEQQCSTQDGTCKADTLLKDEEEPFVCGLYLAKSTIPNSGLGVFSGIRHEVGSVIAQPEIVHQILLGFDGWNDPQNPILEPHQDFQTSLLHHYTWNSYVSGGGFEAPYVETLIPGVGMATNCFLPFVNTRSVMGKSIDTAGLYNKDDDVGPGAGAFSTHYGMTYLAEAPIEAGGEIFSDYGLGYFDGREDVFGMIPLEEEYVRADAMLKALWRVLPKDLRRSENVSKYQSIWNAIRGTFVEDERTRNALPKKVEDISKAVRLGTASFFLDGQNPRSLDYLDSNGYCMDTLQVRTSSIPDAGRGAFAKKKFTSGERILPLPLLQVGREFLDIYSTKYHDDDSVYNRQLLLNYCIGHSNSSFVLLPYAATAHYINHSPSGTANAKLVWAQSDSDPSGFHHDDWMSLTPNDIVAKSHTGLLMHVVATRDIAKGEEVTIDYGKEWEEAWNKHVDSWSKESAKTSASELNLSETEIRTVFEDPYPAGVATACHYRFGGTTDEELAVDNPNNVQNGKLQIDAIEENAFQWTDFAGRGVLMGDYLRPCTVYARHTDAKEGTIYTVKVGNRHVQADWDQIPADYQHFVKEVPRRAILFVDDMFTSHQHSNTAFRHEIGFPDPDNMWPSAWLDVSN